MKLFKYTGWLVALVVLGLFTHAVYASSLPVGTTQFYLAGAGTGSGSTSIQLTSFKTPDGRPITMSMFGTVGYGAIEPQVPAKIEDVSFTGITQNSNQTATLTGVSRGLDFVYPYAASTTLGYSHSGGSTFIITNTASYYYNEFGMPNNNNDFTWATASSSIASKGYVDFVAFNGAAVVAATTGVPGVSQLATTLQTASSTANNGAGYPLVIPASNATSTYNRSTAPLRAVVTQNNGTIDPNFIGGVATSSTLGVGGIAIQSIGKNETIITTTGTSTFAVPTGVTKLLVSVQGAGATGGSCFETGGNGQATGGGGAGGFSVEAVDVTGTSTIQVFVGATTTATTTQAAWSTFGTNGFYLYGTGGNPGTSITNNGQGSSNGGIGGQGFGGDININGQDGMQGWFFNSTGAAPIIPGSGGNSVLGFGGQGGISTGSNTSNAKGYGGGGTGAVCTSTILGTGSNATQGMVRIQY